MSKDVDQWVAQLREIWRARKTAMGSARIGGAVVGVLVLTALALAGFLAARASTAGSPDTALYATQSGGKVFTVPIGTETIVRNGKTLRVVRTKRGETVTRKGRQVTLPGETIRRFGTHTVRDTNTVRDTVTIRDTVTKTETVTQTETVTEPAVTVTVEVTVTEDKGKP